MPTVEFWHLPDVVKATGISKTEIYRQIAAGKFPRQRRYKHQRRTFWISKEVIDWQRSQLGDDFDELLFA